MVLTLLAATVLYLSPMIGNGSDENPYRSALGSYSVGNGISCIPSLPNGKPSKIWSLDIVKLTSIVDSSIVSLPVKDLDASIALTTTQWNNLKTNLTNRGVDTTGLTKDSTLRQVAVAVLAALSNACPDFLKWVSP